MALFFSLPIPFSFPFSFPFAFFFLFPRHSFLRARLATFLYFELCLVLAPCLRRLASRAQKAIQASCNALILLRRIACLLESSKSPSLPQVVVFFRAWE